MNLKIDYNLLKKYKLSLIDYLTLFYIKTFDDKYYDDFRDLFTPNSTELTSLEVKGFIKNATKGSYLRDLGNELFDNPKDDLFKEFYKLYPSRVPNGRGGYRGVSTDKIDGIAAAKTRKKWNSITKGDIELQKHIINCLSYQLDNMKHSNSIQYLQDIDVYLNQATWEKWESELEKKSEKIKSFERDI